jgi:hypothetical protein
VLLYTSSDGNRFIRVHNFAHPLTQSVPQALMGIDASVMGLSIIRKAISKIQARQGLSVARNEIQNTIQKLWYPTQECLKAQNV